MKKTSDKKHKNTGAPNNVHRRRRADYALRESVKKNKIQIKRGKAGI
jgi:hypothetical protein